MSANNMNDNDDDNDCFDSLNGGDDTNDTVWVYQPIQYGNKVPSNYHNDLTCTHIGGKRSILSTASAASTTTTITTPSCSICSDLLYPLLQFYISEKQYTIQVYACNRPSCISSLFPTSYNSNSNELEENQHNYSGSLHYGGNGVVVGRRIIPSIHRPTTTITTPSSHTADVVVTDEVEPMEWGQDDNIDNDTNLEFEELESQLAAIETGEVIIPTKKPKPKAHILSSEHHHITSTKNNEEKQLVDGFPCYLLHGLREPPDIMKLKYNADQNDDDLDDVGLTGNYSYSAKNNHNHSGIGNNDEKIQRMLQQYMNEIEDDEDLLNILHQQQGIPTTNSNNKSKSSTIIAEKDERLSNMDRTLFTYTDRLKRIPKQVIRHGGNSPLWSIPIVSIKQQQQQQQQKSQKKGCRSTSNPMQQNNPGYGYEQPIPVCKECGAVMQFELQILPSILHVLNVDEFSVETSRINNNSATETNVTKFNYNNATGGMDWGNIVVYTCPNIQSCHNKDVYCIIQDSIDHIHASINSKKNHQAKYNITSQTQPMQQGVNSTSTNNSNYTANENNLVVVIPEGSKFDVDDDDDGIVYQEEEFDEYDDGSVW